MVIQDGINNSMIYLHQMLTPRKVSILFPILIVLVMIGNYVQAQPIPSVQSVEKKLIDKTSGWRLLGTNDNAIDDGSNFYFYFLPDGQLTIYAQSNAGISDKKLIHKGTYRIFNIGIGRVGVAISDFYGNMDLFFMGVIHKSKIGNTSFEYFYNTKEKQMRLIYSGEEGKRYYENIFQ